MPQTKCKDTIFFSHTHNSAKIKFYCVAVAQRTSELTAAEESIIVGDAVLAFEPVDEVGEVIERAEA